jgi:hypothetical protein
MFNLYRTTTKQTGFITLFNKTFEVYELEVLTLNGLEIFQNITHLVCYGRKIYKHKFIY